MHLHDLLWKSCHLLGHGTARSVQVDAIVKGQQFLRGNTELLFQICPHVLGNGQHQPQALLLRSATNEYPLKSFGDVMDLEHRRQSPHSQPPGQHGLADKVEKRPLAARELRDHAAPEKRMSERRRGGPAAIELEVLAQRQDRARQAPEIDRRGQIVISRDVRAEARLRNIIESHRQSQRAEGLAHAHGLNAVRLARR